MCVHHTKIVIISQNLPLDKSRTRRRVNVDAYYVRKYDQSLHTRCVIILKRIQRLNRAFVLCDLSR